MINKKNILIITDVMCSGGVDTYITQLIDYGLMYNWNVTLLLNRNSKTSLPQKVQNKCAVVFKNIYHRNNSERIISKNFAAFLKKFNNLALAHVISGIPWSCICIREILLSFKFCVINTEQYVYDNISFTSQQVERIKNIYAKTHTCYI